MTNNVTEIIAQNGKTDNVTHDQFLKLATDLGRAARLDGPDLDDYVGKLVAEAKAIRNNEPEEIKPSFNFLSFDDLLEQPDPEFLVKGLIQKDTIGMIFGDPGAGKSFVALDLILDACSGSPFAGRFDIPEALKVAYATSEGQSSIKPRLVSALNGSDDVGKARQALNDNLSLVFETPQLFDIQSEQSADRFIHDVSSAGKEIDLLIIDTLNNASIGANENDTRDMTIVVQSAKRIGAELGCAVLLVHHSNKNGHYRGSSALHGAMDLMIEIKQDFSGRQIKFFKIKDKTLDSPAHNETFYFDLVSDHVGQSAFCDWSASPPISQVKATKKEIVTQEIIEILSTASGELTQSDIVTRIEAAGRNTVLDALRELEQAGKVLVKQGDHNAKIYQLVMFEPNSVV